MENEITESSPQANIPPVAEDAFYPRLIERYKAMLVDVIVIIAAMILVSIVFSEFENVPWYLRAGMMFLLIFLYEPLLVSLTGGTLGHKAMQLQIKSYSDRTKNVLFPLAILRFFIRWFLGWISFLTISGNKEKRAIHDLICNSIVVYKDME